MGSVAGESRFGQFPGLSPQASIIQPAAQTSLSRTSYHQFFPGGFANTYAYENQLAQHQLKTVEERIKKGKDNNQLHLENISQRMNDICKNVPDIEELRKKKEDMSHAVWEKYLRR